MEKDTAAHRRHRPGPGAPPSGGAPRHLKAASEMVELQRSRSVGGLLQKGDPLRCVKKLSRELESEDQGRDLQSDTEDANCIIGGQPPNTTIIATDPPPAPPSLPQTEPPSATPIATEPASSNTAYSSMPSKGHLCLPLRPLTLPPPGTRKVLHTLSLPVLKADPEEEKQEKNRDSLRKLDPDGGWAGPAEPELESIKLDEPLGKEKPSVFVEIDLGDHAEEVVTGTMKEEKQSEMDMGGSSEDETRTSWVCCIPYSTRRKAKDSV
ncbi:uncharacterized protein C13orf46 homolog [Lynx canadensis]|uniref:uncharacterized protein C13orf46 homolog n=1 Tax=Lynx canadensis TaxID=61383 RepID=UPI0011B098A6|nr:uncharacterized protein C13orf46 homolog [Lynx canadensis]